MTCTSISGETTVAGISGEINKGLRAVKSAMNEWEERNADAKQEVLEFGTNEGGTVQILRSWVSASAYVNKRTITGNGLW